jgi:hypothetical protein
MKTIGFDRPLYILPFDHRGSFEKKMFGWHGDFRRQQRCDGRHGSPTRRTQTSSFTQGDNTKGESR